MSELEKSLKEFKSQNKLPRYRGYYAHKSNGIIVNVLSSTDKYVLLKWSNGEVVRSIDFMTDFIKCEKNSRTVH